MARSRSVPSRGLVSLEDGGNPFYSEKVQDECRLQALRPRTLPVDGSDRPLMESFSGIAAAQGNPGTLFEPTGKGRGGMNAGLLGPLQPTEYGDNGMKTEGAMPSEKEKEVPKTMGSVGSQSMGQQQSDSPDGLQRALEGELVQFLRQQNSQLMDELAHLRATLEKRSVGNPTSGMESSPWSTVDGSGESATGFVGTGGPGGSMRAEGSTGFVGTLQPDRPGRHGSRTPRSRIREEAVSPRKKDSKLYTPNGVPDGPPPDSRDPLPPVPPLPVAPMGGQEVSFGDASFNSGLYDTCESKQSMKNGDLSWKPQNEAVGGPGILSPSEAKQMWLEREVRSLKNALDRVSIPQGFHQSEYWNAGFEKRTPSSDLGHPVSAMRLPASDACGGCGTDAHRHRVLHGGSGTDDLQRRAFAGAPSVPGGIRAAYMHGEHLSRDRALQERGEPPGQDRASIDALAARFDQARAQHAVLGDQHAQARAQHVANDGRLGDARALHAHHDGLYGHARAQHLEGGTSSAWELHDSGQGRFCAHPQHGVGGGGLGDGMSQPRIDNVWGESTGGMNTKGELPDLPSSATPLQFGDWLHLSTPVMKDISSVAGWWWDRTLSEAKLFYEDWKRSSPLQRIQIVPVLPAELREPRFQRTEQRGIQMLLKSIPEAEQQALVTDRVLSSTAIIYKLLVRFQPGGAGEKQLLLNQLTMIPKCKDVNDIAAGIRTWRRYYGRAKEVEATLPDGVLLLKALDVPLQQLGQLDPQAAFRLSQSRMQLYLDQQPTHESLWAFSQCLLAEAETLALLQTSSPSTSPAVPLKIKQLDGDAKPGTMISNGDSKSKSTALVDKPCRYFLSDTGCKAGKACKCQHSFETAEDKASRCWICGAKDHRKQDCKLRSTPKKPGEPTGSGGGNGQGRGGSGNNAPPTSKPSSTTGGKAGAAAAKVLAGAENPTTSTSTAEGSNSQPEVTNAAGGDGKVGGNEGGSASNSDKTTELLNEATQLLKSLRIQPKLKVMQITGLNQADDDLILLDSGATHALRPAHDEGEWQLGEPTSVQLADGTTDMFRLKKGTKILLSNPNAPSRSTIIPMGGLAELDFELKWTNGQCRLQDDEGREINVMVQNGCPMISRQDGQEILQWLELFYVHQRRKLAVVKTLMVDPNLVDKRSLDAEVAMTLKMKELFPDLPDEIMMKLVPRLEQVTAENFGNQLPWNRHKRRKLKAKHIVMHIFSGADHRYWERQCSNGSTEVICVDLQGSVPANLHDKNVYAYLLSLCATGRVRAVLLGPPCRTISALRYQADGGPGVLRDDEHPYGRADLSQPDMDLVQGDTVLWFRGLSLFILAEDLRDPDQPPTQLLLEQPEDPARYRKPEDVAQHRYFSMFRTLEWQHFQERFGIKLLHFDQHPMGHKKRKPTTLATNMVELSQLDGIRGEPEDEPQASAAYRAMSLQQRMQESKTWACWAPGLKAAISTALNRHLQRLTKEPPGAQPVLRPLNQVALEAWKQHFLHDHLPARRDCMYCVRAQGRSRPHRRVSHPDAFTLSIDLSGKMSVGKDQGGDRCRYIMVACYTFPVSGDGRPLLPHPGAPTEDKDQPLPSMDLHGGAGRDPPKNQPLPSMDLHGGGDHEMEDPHGGLDDDEVMLDDGGDLPPMPEDAHGLAEPPDPLQEQQPPEPGPDGLAETSMRSAFDVWHRLVEDAQNVGVKNLTFTEVIPSRAVKDVLPALARIYSRLRYLGLPLYRIHCDRARELTSAPVRRWTLDRGVITTLTTGSSYKTNGRVENEVGAVKRAVRTLISAKLCPLESWPLALRHVGERRLRNQLQGIGWPAAPLLKFGTKAFALKKSWQDRYCPWRDVREEVVVMGPDRCSSLTTTNYYVQSVTTGRFFFTDDVVQPTSTPDPVEPPGEPNVFLPERQHPGPLLLDGVPTRRLRGKTAVPAIQSMFDIEGEDWNSEGLFCPHNVFQVPVHLQTHFEMDEIDGSNASSWTLSTEAENTSASSQADTPTMQSDVEEFGGGDVEEAPNNRAGGSHPVASGMSSSVALRRIHCNLGAYIESEYNKLDATSEDQSLWIGALVDAIKMKVMVEQQLQDAQACENQKALEKLDQEFLVTKTISNSDVWGNLEMWRPSIEAEYQQLVVNKQAVRQITKSELHQLSQQRGVPIEILPGKMVHTRKAGSGAFKSRAVVCGNYQQPDNAEHYAGGSDANQVRGMLRLGALNGWRCGGTDIRTAFLNAPRRDNNKLLAMEIPVVFRKLGLAESQHIWLIDKALYGLTSSPRDWGLHRDETVPKLNWKRERFGREVEGAFKRTPDENMWRIEETDCASGEVIWSGLMSIYVDDLLFVAEDGVIDAATAAIEKTWSISAVEKTGEDAVVKYCGFEIEAMPEGGFKISQNKYEAEMLQRWNITKATDYPHYTTTEEDEVPDGPVDTQQIKQAQAVAGALLWLSTRTRPDLSVGVATVCRLATRNPVRAIEIGTALMEYVKGTPGGLFYPAGVPHGDVWGERQQLKIARHPRLLEVMADIAFGTGTKHRSVQGIATFLGGCIISWNTTVQPFVTHSTAESELVAYCDALNVGRSTEAMLCSMLGESVGTASIERVIYGDNVAAIGIASGNGGTSWRTRHLRIRASYVKEALEGVAPGGAWRLMHLRGVDLVADGLTKPLLGQAFLAFLRDLGMQGRRSEDGGGEEPGVTPQVAAVTLAVGSMLLSGVDSEEIGDEAEFDAIWACGATLMALGAIYAGQITYSGLKSCAKLCLKRLKGPSHHQDEDSHQRSFEESTKSGASVKLEHLEHATPSKSSTSLNIQITSGSQMRDENPLTSSLPSRGGVRTSAAGSSEQAAAASSLAAAGSSEQAAAASSLAAAGSSEQAAARSSVAASSPLRVESKAPKKELDLSNPWNKFQHEHAGEGLSTQTLAKMYRYHKAKKSK